MLLVVLHHIAGDGWSLSPLWRDLAAFYRSRRSGAAAALDALPVQYADYTLWQQAVLGDESDPQSALARQLSYWTQRLKDLPDQLDLPATARVPAVASHRGGCGRGVAAGGSCTAAWWSWRGPARPACSWCCRPALRRC